MHNNWTVSRWLSSLWPVLVLVLYFWILPPFSISEYLSSILPSVEKSLEIDILFITVMAEFIGTTIAFLFDNGKLVSVRCSIADWNDEHPERSYVNSPAGPPIRLEVNAGISYRNRCAFWLAKKTKMLLVVSWQEEWLKAEVDCVGPLEVSGGELRISLEQHTNFPDCQLKPTLMFVTKHEQSSYSWATFSIRMCPLLKPFVQLDSTPRKLVLKEERK